MAGAVRRPQETKGSPGSGKTIVARSPINLARGLVESGEGSLERICVCYKV